MWPITNSACHQTEYIGGVLVDLPLVQRACAGDSSAWREIYNRHAPAVRRLLQGFASLAAADVEDLVQETFVRASRSIESLRDSDRLRPWLLTIARSLALNALRQRASRARLLAAYAADPAAGAPAPRLDDGAAVRTRREQLVRELIASLPAGPEADTVRLFYLEGKLSAREIAEQLGVGKSAVTMRLERFRARVKARLAAEFLAAGEVLP